MAKHKLLAGLLVGGAAFAAYHALDLEQREALKDAARDRYNAFKDRAIDYAFYAADAADDFKESLNDKLEAKDDAPAWKTVPDEVNDEPADDIVLSSDQVTDLPDSGAATTAEDDPADDQAKDDQPD
ncbi:hypothetical protein [Levilactobacillus tujiorum]|uniref:YtxH domain-containing protein n=1 Tax=Levilactobacillus tujiorum TaxID=2912243 RepID=A0ABX1L421_9LACO|nr:hypothetical protein [Levilactobacillus tujiorum]MCH5464781.1 hypothetical protein [Levilactobacillus tujiorum]NLR12113.1 hypothetical protein [Lactobacillus sp. HBUAS51387]NLR29760.1 hypothetical protein [Levilactobacillus tujiorum]